MTHSGAGADWQGRRVSWRRWAVTTGAASAFLLGVSPTAWAASTGAVSGTVSEAGTHKLLAGVTVCAFRPTPAVVSEEEEEETESSPASEPHCVPSGSTGEYTIEGLEPASYYVQFNPPVTFGAGKLAFSEQDFISQLYEDAFTEATAKLVPVTAGATATGTDAALEPGGEISGRVTAAAGGAPLPEATVCALQSPLERVGDFGCAQTSAGGEYTIYGLAPGAYSVVFGAHGYASQAYNGKSDFGEATPVTVVVGKVAGGIDAALLPRTEMPISAEGEPGPGGPAGSGPGSSLGGGTGSGVGAGSLLALRSRLLAVRGGAADVVLTCHAATRCHGRLRLFVLRRVRRGHREVLTRVALGGRSFRLAAAHRRTLAIRLDRHGIALLHARRGLAAIELAVVLGGAGPPEIIAVRLKGPGRS